MAKIMRPRRRSSFQRTQASLVKRKARGGREKDGELDSGVGRSCEGLMVAQNAKERERGSVQPVSVASLPTSKARQVAQDDSKAVVWRIKSGGGLSSTVRSESSPRGKLGLAKRWRSKWSVEGGRRLLIGCLSVRSMQEIPRKSGCGSSFHRGEPGSATGRRRKAGADSAGPPIGERGHGTGWT